MRAIVIAAGRGSRLEGYTDQRPKCLVEVSGRSILSFQLEAFRENAVDELHIVRGYLADKLVVDGATYWSNDDWANNNILLSLFCAQGAMDGPFISTYSDIVYTPSVLRALLQSPHDISLVVDRRWADAYHGRSDHPIAEAELTEIDRHGNVTRVGKQVGHAQALGEFIGLAKYSAVGAKLLTDVFADVRRRVADDQPFQAAKQFRRAYLTDLFCEMIDRGHTIGVTTIDGGWREIDTVEDLHRLGSAGWTRWVRPEDASRYNRS